jgi:hypothetical protein
MADNDFHAAVVRLASDIMDSLQHAYEGFYDGDFDYGARKLDEGKQAVVELRRLNKEEILKRVEIRAGGPVLVGTPWYEGIYSEHEEGFDPEAALLPGQVEKMVERPSIPVEDLLSPLPPTTVRDLIQERLDKTD